MHVYDNCINMHKPYFILTKTLTGYDVLVYVKVLKQRHLKQCHICIQNVISEQKTLNDTLSEKKVQKLSLGLYLFKRYTFVPKGCILVP